MGQLPLCPNILLLYEKASVVSETETYIYMLYFLIFKTQCCPKHICTLTGCQVLSSEFENSNLKILAGAGEVQIYSANP